MCSAEGFWFGSQILRFYHHGSPDKQTNKQTNSGDDGSRSFWWKFGLDRRRERDTERERESEVPLCPWSHQWVNHTLHPMAPDTHTLTHTEANDMLGNVVRGKPETGKTEGRRKTITRKTKKYGRPVSVSLLFSSPSPPSVSLR